MSSKISIYNTETGEMVRKHPIDAREQVKSGRWSYDPVEVQAKESEPEASAPAVTTPTAATKKAAPRGRKRK